MLTPTRSKNNLERGQAKSARVEESFTSGSSGFLTSSLPSFFVVYTIAAASFSRTEIGRFSLKREKEMFSSVKATGGGPRSKKHFLPVGRARTI